MNINEFYTNFSESIWQIYFISISTTVTMQNMKFCNLSQIVAEPNFRVVDKFWRIPFSSEYEKNDAAKKNL